VAVDQQGVPAEGPRPRGELLAIPLHHRGAALPEAVHVDDRDDVVQSVEAPQLERLVHAPLGHLAVTEEHPAADVQVEQARGERHADRRRQPLPERARRDVDVGKERCRMSFEPASELPQREELLVGEGAGGLEHGVQQRRRVALREDEPIVVGVARALPVVVEVIGQQDRHQIGRRRAGGRMAGTCRGGRADAVGPELGREPFPVF
jgi:hypothetical protein